MDKKAKVTKLLEEIAEQAEELLDNDATEPMSAEEVLVLATELTLGTPVTTIQYSSPVGTVDRNKVTFMLDDEFEFPLFGEEYYEDQDL